MKLKDKAQKLSEVYEEPGNPEKRRIRGMKLVNVLLVLLIGVSFAASLYPLSYRLDQFPWGNSQSDGLFMIVIPVWILPFIYLLTLVKWIINRKRVKADIAKYANFIYPIAISLITLFVLPDNQFLYWIGFVLGVLVGLYSLLEIKHILS